MTDYKYDPDLPYVVTTNGRINRFEAWDEAEMFADLYLNAHVINTTPKPRVPEDAEHVVWIFAATPNYRMYAEKKDGLWFCEDALNGRALEDLPGVTPETVFTVLDERGSWDRWEKWRDLAGLSDETTLVNEEKSRVRASNRPYRLEDGEWRAVELAAVVEKVRELTADPGGFTYRDFDRIARGVPADALREVKADVWDEGAEMGHRLYAESMHTIDARNPYRAAKRVLMTHPHDGHDLGETCLDCQRREEQS